jgi:hypothetical protein
MSTQQRSKLLRSLQNWKAKAIARRHENKALKKRLTELIHSRDAWRVKAQTYQQQLADVQAQHVLEKKIAPLAIVTVFRPSKRLSR